MAGPAEDVATDVDALYRAHADRVAAWAQRLGGPGVDVEDVVQEVFLTAHRLWSGFRGDARPTTWLFRITANVVRHRRRKERWRRWLGGSAGDVADHLPADRPTPIEVLEQKEAARLVYGALDGLPDRYRTVLVLFELEGHSGEEIAELLGVKLATVWVWLHRGRQRLLGRLEKTAGPRAAQILPRVAGRGGA